jgi:lipopolysaccharide/colanic/teichoic acid biosynthesis glycosyltransferase
MSPGWQPVQKRIFDLVVIGLLAVVLLPVLTCCALAIYLLDGRPIFYFSKRRIYRQHTTTVVKFRTMRRDAERIANRDTVPITSTRFLNLPIDSPLYTLPGRWIERLMLTELPQLYHVLQGQMSLVGNRPLPENVIASLREMHPHVEQRFGMPAGLTGPTQLVGRDAISDAQRLRLEIAYCQAVKNSYSIWLDMRILFHTVLVGLIPGHRFTPEQVLSLVSRASDGGQRVGLASPRLKLRSTSDILEGTGRPEGMPRLVESVAKPAGDSHTAPQRSQETRRASVG